jgi:plasmid rolling circle replication initiator protein Rep
MKIKGGDIQREKRENGILIRYLHKNNNNTKASAVKRCMTNAIYALDNHGKKHLYNGWFCHNRLCSICQKRRAIKDNLKVKKVIQFTENHIDDKYKYIFLTFTLKNVKADKVKATQKHINRSICRLFGYKAVKHGVLGRIKTTEITYNANRDDYHVHAHILAMVRPLLVNSRKRLCKSDWVRLWQKASKVDYSPVIKVQHVKNHDDIDTIANYLTKTMNYTRFITSSKVSKKSEVIDTIYNALQYQHRITFSGIFRASNRTLKDLRKNSMQGGTKGVKRTKYKPVMYMFYKWDFNYARQVLYDRMTASDFDLHKLP